MIVVADTSVLINLCCVGQAELLPALFREVFIPPAVAVEFRELAELEGRFAGIEIPSWVREQSPREIPQFIRTLPRLHAGERAALSLALELPADAILIDEREAHAAAHRLGLRTFGLLAVLLQAKEAALLPTIAPVIAALEHDANFWLARPIRAVVLRLAGEAP